MLIKGKRRGLSAEQKAEVWNRWKAGHNRQERPALRNTGAMSTRGALTGVKSGARNYHRKKSNILKWRGAASSQQQQFPKSSRFLVCKRTGNFHDHLKGITTAWAAKSRENLAPQAQHSVGFIPNRGGLGGLAKTMIGFKIPRRENRRFGPTFCCGLWLLALH
jgi:hypothetical protein